MRRTRWLAHASLSVLTAAMLGVGTAATADDPNDPPPSGASGPMETRLIDVGDLTAGLTDFQPDPVGVSGLWCPMGLDEDAPLFGGEGEETNRPWGGASDVIDLVRNAVGAPADRGNDGVLMSAQGESTLLVHAPHSLLDAVEAFLSDLVRDSRTIVTVDVVALSGDPATLTDGDVAAAVTRGALLPLGGARACGGLAQQVVGREGGQASYIQDYDVEVADTSKGGDPIVGVLSDGLVFDARPVAATPQRILLDLHAGWSRRLPSKSAESKESGAIELPEIDVRAASALLSLKPGVWTALPTSGARDESVVFAVRATARPYDVKAREPIDLTPDGTPAPGGPLVLRKFSILDLATRVPHRRGHSIDLWPSNYTPREPPELPEPKELYPMEMLCSTLKEVVDPERWDEGTSVDLKAGTLFVRNTIDVLGHVAEMLDGLRGHCVRMTRLRAVVATMPLASFPEYFAGLDDASLVADGGAALLARAGARVVDRAALRLAPGQRDAAFGGRERNYVGDYDVEIAQSAIIGNPIIRHAFAGISFDVLAVPTGRGAGVLAEIRLDRSTPRASKLAPTPYGDIECPSQGVLRMHGATVIPLGATRLVSANLDGTDVTLVLVSAAGD